MVEGQYLKETKWISVVETDRLNRHGFFHLRIHFHTTSTDFAAITRMLLKQQALNRWHLPSLLKRKKTSYAQDLVPEE